MRHIANVITGCVTWKVCIYTRCQSDVIHSNRWDFVSLEQPRVPPSCSSDSLFARPHHVFPVSHRIHPSPMSPLSMGRLLSLETSWFLWIGSAIHSCFHAILLCTAAVTEDPVFATRAESWTVLWRLTAQCQSDWKWQHWPAFSGEPLASRSWWINGLFSTSVSILAVGDGIGKYFVRCKFKSNKTVHSETIFFWFCWKLACRPS